MVEEVFVTNHGINAQNLFVTDIGELSFDPNYQGGGVYEFTPDGERRTFAIGLSRPLGLAFNREGDLFVSNLFEARDLQIYARLRTNSPATFFRLQRQ